MADNQCEPVMPPQRQPLVVPLLSDIEFEDVLPRQVVEDKRVVEVIVSSEDRRWPGLALTDGELDAIFDEGRPSDAQHPEATEPGRTDRN